MTVQNEHPRRAGRSTANAPCCRILFERHGQINLRLNDNLPQAELAVVGLRRAGGWGDLRHILLQVAPLPRLFHIP